MNQNLKTLSLVKYVDYSVIKYENGKPIGEILTQSNKVHFEYIDKSITENEVISKYIKQMRSNCIADVIVFEIYQMQVEENSYNLMLNMFNRNKSTTIREYFKENLFTENSSVLHMGTFTYIQGNLISNNNSLVC